MQNSRAMIHEGYSDVLAGLFPGSTIANIERLTGGVSADVYRLDLLLSDGQFSQVVLRAHGERHSGHDAGLEFALLTALYDGGLAVPQPLLVDTSCELTPEPFLLMVFVDGKTHIPEAERTHHIEIMAETLAQIHNLPLTGLPALPARTEPWPELLDYFPEGKEWQNWAARLGSLEIPAFEGTPQLLHGDFWPENLLWKGQRIAAVLDWEDSAIGDRHADVAAARVELRYLFGNQIMDEFTAAYIEHLPIDQYRLMLWQIYVAAAAQKYMGHWGLPADREAHMRHQAGLSIREAFDFLLK